MNNNEVSNNSVQVDNKSIYQTKIKELFQAKNQEVDDIFIEYIAEYVNSLAKLNRAFPIDINYVMSTLVSQVQNIKFVDPMLENSVYDNHVMRVACYQDLKYVKLDMFDLCTNVLTNKSLLSNNDQNQQENPLATSGAEYFTQMVYGVSISDNYAHRINDMGQEEVAVYSNTLSTNPVISSMLNMIAINTKLPINYVISLTLNGNGMSILQNEFDKICGDGKFKGIVDKLDSLELSNAKSNNKNFQNGSLDSLFSSSNNIVIEDTRNNQEIIYKCEREMIEQFFKKEDQEYIRKHSDDFLACISTPELQLEFEAIKSNNIEKAYVREYKSGFIDIKFVFLILICIVFLIYIFSKLL
ncbi:MAG: hypothetical protein R3Y13_05505 [bacterium]